MRSGLSTSSSAKSGSESSGESGSESNGPEKPASHMHTYSAQHLLGLGNNPVDEYLDGSGYKSSPGSTQAEESGTSCGEDDVPHDLQQVEDDWETCPTDNQGLVGWYNRSAALGPALLC